MIDSNGKVAKRAQRLLRCYPRSWRDRYGEEFTQLLIDDITERPRSPSRAADVVRNGLLARLTGAGLTGDALDAQQQLRAGLAVLGLALSAFVAVGVSIWSQLAIDWQWSAPDAPATTTAMTLMWGAVVSFSVLAVLAAVPVVWALGRSFASGRARGLVLPAATVALGLAVLIAGSLHFGHGWPGTGGHPWDGREVVPDSVARFAWAATLWVTSYWAHPGALGSFPAAEIVWMVVSPVALLAALVGTAKTLRRLPLSTRVLRYESWIGMATVLAMAVFLAGTGSWLVSGEPGPRALYRVGAIHWASMAVMAAALVLGFRAARRAVAAAATELQ
ncbi:MAG TPA: hypothetical protein VF549_16040 [Solirubrobacteraceae bacterium]|jgi:hypothetical protein